MVHRLDGSGAANALEVEGVTKTFRVHRERTTSLKQVITGLGRNRYDEFTALKDVSFDVREGEVFGVIGHNGSGKSTLLKCMAGILQPNQGEVRVHRRMSALLELGAGFEPELTGRDNVFLNAAILGMTRREIAARFDGIVDFSGLGSFIDSPVKTYSSGMYVRLAFAVAINVDPSLLIIDEILAVGDVTFQQRCMEKFLEFRDDGRTIVIVTHDLQSVKNLCDRAIWLEWGHISGEGNPAELVDRYTERMLGGRLDDDSAMIRRGSGEIKIERTEILVGGTPTQKVRTGETATLRLHYHTTEPVARPIFSVQIENVQGVTVTAPCTRDVGLIPQSLTGAGTVDVTIPVIPLLPGPYTIHTEVTGFHRSHTFDHIQNALRFDVVTGTSNETEGIVTMAPIWELGQP